MIEIALDPDTCQGYGNCVLVAPDLFALDDQDGKARLAIAVVGDEHREAVSKAVYDCPTEAIGFVEQPGAPPAGS